MLRYLYLTGLLLACLCPGSAQSAAMATVGQDDGYSGRILDKISARWKPPRQLIGAHSLKLILSVDGEGRLLDCRVQKASGLDALDASACAAAKAAAPYGTPPYGMPATIHFSFWTGGLDSRVPVQDEKAPALLFSERANEDARFASERAQAKAQAAAKKTGKQPPGLLNKTEAGKNGKSLKKEDPTIDVNAAAPAQGSVVKSQTEELDHSLQAKAAGSGSAFKSREKYISKITWDLRNAMFVPVQTKPGVYHASVHIECDKSGNITSYNMLKGSGDPLLDKYVMQGIERAGKVIPPPEEYGHSFDLTFKVVRQAKAKKKPSSAQKPAEDKSPEAAEANQ